MTCHFFGREIPIFLLEMSLKPLRGFIWKIVPCVIFATHSWFVDLVTLVRTCCTLASQLCIGLWRNCGHLLHLQLLYKPLSSLLKAFILFLVFLLTSFCCGRKTCLLPSRMRFYPWPFTYIISSSMQVCRSSILSSTTQISVYISWCASSSCSRSNVIHLHSTLFEPALHTPCAVN